ncbi:MAG: hypothetical protein AAGF73_08020 [Actinomycetota bacterium]
MSSGPDPSPTLWARAVATIDDPRPRSVVAVTLLALVVLPIIGLLAVTAGQLADDEAILDEVTSAISAGRLTEEYVPRSMSGRFIDVWTDCHTITIGSVDTAGASPWSVALRNPTLGNCGRMVPHVEAWTAGGELSPHFDYFRYWHGTTSVTRPLIATVGLEATRIVTAWVLVAAIAAFCWSFARRQGVIVTAALIGPFALTGDVLDLPGSLHQAWALSVALVGAVVAHEAVYRRRTPGRIMLSTVIAGAVFSFFDVLTIPPGVWALTVFVVAAAATRHVRGWALAGTAALATFGWMLGFGWMWAAKWALSIPIYGVDEVRDEVVEQTTFRLDGEPGWEIDLSFGASWTRMRDLWFLHGLTKPVLWALIILVIVVLVKRARAAGAQSLLERWPDRLVMLTPALLVPVWFEILRNHTQIHTFPLKSVPIAVGIVAAAFLVRLSPIERTPPSTEAATTSASPPVDADAPDPASTRR